MIVHDRDKRHYSWWTHASVYHHWQVLKGVPKSSAAQIVRIEVVQPCGETLNWGRCQKTR